MIAFAVSDQTPGENHQWEPGPGGGLVPFLLPVQAGRGLGGHSGPASNNQATAPNVCGQHFADLGGQ